MCLNKRTCSCKEHIIIRPFAALIAIAFLYGCDDKSIHCDGDVSDCLASLDVCADDKVTTFTCRHAFLSMYCNKETQFFACAEKVIKWTIQECLGDNDDSATCSQAVHDAIAWFKMDCSSPGRFTGKVCEWLKNQGVQTHPDSQTANFDEPATEATDYAVQDHQEIKTSTAKSDDLEITTSTADTATTDHLAVKTDETTTEHAISDQYSISSPV